MSPTFELLEKWITQNMTHILVWAALISLHYMYFPKLVRPQPRPLSAVTLQAQNWIILNPEDCGTSSTSSFVSGRLVCIIDRILLPQCASFFIPKFLFPDKRDGNMVWLMLLCVVLFLILVAIPDQMMHPERPLNRGMIISSVLLISLVFIMSGNWKNNRPLVSVRKACSGLNTRRNRMVSLLKAQINPLFLFNTLNNIYTLASKNLIWRQMLFLNSRDDDMLSAKRKKIMFR